MSSIIDDLKKKIIYKSSYRGSKEMDILLRCFIKDNIHNLNFNELKKLYEFIKIDDDNLLKFKQGIKTQPDISKNKISNLFKKYVLPK